MESDVVLTQGVEAAELLEDTDAESGYGGFPVPALSADQLESSEGVVLLLELGRDRDNFFECGKLDSDIVIRHCWVGLFNRPLSGLSSSTKKIISRRFWKPVAALVSQQVRAVAVFETHMAAPWITAGKIPIANWIRQPLWPTSGMPMQ